MITDYYYYDYLNKKSSINLKLQYGSAVESISSKINTRFLNIEHDLFLVGNGYDFCIWKCV